MKTTNLKKRIEALETLAGTAHFTLPEINIIFVDNQGRPCGGLSSKGVFENGNEKFN